MQYIGSVSHSITAIEPTRQVGLDKYVMHMTLHMLKDWPIVPLSNYGIFSYMQTMIK